MHDLISRQAAIDAIHAYWQKRLETLPTIMTEDGEAFADIKSMDKIIEHNKTLSAFIKQLPAAHCDNCPYPEQYSLHDVQRARHEGEIAGIKALAKNLKEISTWVERLING